MWAMIISTLLAAFAAGLLYISFRAAHFGFVRKIAGRRRAVARLLCFAAFSALSAALWLAWNMMNALVCIVHLVLFWLICDLTAFLAAKIRGAQPRRQAAGIAAIALCALYLTGGWIAEHHVWETKYAFQTDKMDGTVRIVQITDVHIGATFGAERFAEYVERINALSPDAVVVTGDFTDDDSSREDMLGACEALGALKARWGVFFVYGNHDKGYYRRSSSGWTNAECRQALERSGVTVLEDECRTVGGVLTVAGRKDRSEEQRGGSRLSAEELLRDADRGTYIVLLDHQPYDFDAEAAAGADLVLCGHTHGGQFIPINHVGEWTGENCLRYGHEKRLDTDFIVSSGISNWAFRFKTGCFSEYTVIDVTGVK